MKRFVVSVILALATISAFAQVDRHDVRAGNRQFRKDAFKEAEISYRKAALKDSLSMAAQYNLASSLYRQQDFEGAGKALDTVKEQAQFSADADRYWFNQGDVALQKKDYAAAVEAFKQSLLKTPGDIEAKENYIYAKLMLQNQQNGGGGGDQNQDQNDQNNQDQNDQNNQDQNQDQNNQDQNNQDQNQNQDNGQNDQDRNNDQSQGQQPQESKISPQQAQQMLQAIQAKEKETQDKVNKEKAALLRSKQKEKNW